MAEGDSGGISSRYNFSNTGGACISGPLADVTVEQQLEDIICLARSGDTIIPSPAPEPASIARLSLGLVGLGFSRRACKA